MSVLSWLRDGSAAPGGSDASRAGRPHRGWRATLAAAIVAGLGVVGFYSAHGGHLATALLVSGSCLLVGGLLGFLFAIPKALQGPAAPPHPHAPADAAAPDQPSRYRANTNLEEVSDWLTKILVGVGLTQLTALQDQARAFGDYFGIGFASGDIGPRLAVAALLYFSVAGFLFGYLWTRLFLGGALAEADALTRVEKKLDEHQQQAQFDATALALVGQQLSAGLRGGASARMPTKADIATAIVRASEPVRVQVFYQAEGIRRENWREPSSKPLMERTIPIFEALAAADPDARYHRTYGQLGYALKDQRVPDWAGAERALSKAIAIRGSAAEYGYAMYELNRAVCRINADPNFQAKKPSESETQKAIRADLQAATAADLGEIIARTPEIAAWQQLNP